MSDAKSVLEAQPRADFGSQTARRLRRQGLVPAVIYGHKEDVVSVALSGEAVHRALRLHQRIVDVACKGKTEKCLIQEVQWDSIGKEIHHVDFKRVSADEKLQVTVPIQLRGHAIGATAAAGGILNQPVHELEVECLMTAIPEYIRVNIDKLMVGQAIHLKELQLPPGVKALGDPDEIIVQVTKKMEEKVAEVTEAGPAEPEVIARKPTEEGVEEEKK
jgi:large subunit ribosomal protein L25